MCMVTFNWEESDANEKAESFRKRKRLSWAVIEVTEACNLNCAWCYANSGASANRMHMPIGMLESLLKRLSDAGVGQVTYSGGEPSVYPRIREAVGMAKDMGFVVHMNTNGFIFTKELARDLKSSGLSQIQTNIDSLKPERHDYIRGREGSFEGSARAIANAKEAGITPVSQTVLTRLNEKEIFGIFDFSRGLGAERCRVWDMAPSDGVAKSNSCIAPTDYVETLERLYEFALQKGLKGIESGEPLFPLGRRIKVPVTGGFCVSYFGAYTTISINGDAFYCAAYRKPLYNVFSAEGPLDEIHRQRLGEFIKENVSLPDSCSRCGFAKICNGGCIVRRESNMGVDSACKHARNHLEKPMLRTL